MNEQRETANTGMQQAIPGFDGGYRPIRLCSGQAPAGRKTPDLFLQKSQRDFGGKRYKGTMLPQAHLAFGSGTRPELAGPRTSYL
jgi:hypothetical protein